MHAHHTHHLAGHGAMRLPGLRAKRGDVQAATMILLAEKDMHGYQIIQELNERSGGAWNPSPGSIYPALQSLEQHRLVSSTEAGGKRVFSLTDSGRERASALPDQAPWAGMAEDSDASRRLRDGFHGLMIAAAQVARGGAEEQISEAADIVADARKRIYLMLADEK